ncbi:MAG: hypothetical protein V7668_17715 [Cereibacter changlensis]
MIRLALAFIALGLPALAQEPAPWVGIWAADPEWCAFADSIGEQETTPIRITEAEFQGYENRCEITATHPLQVLPGAELVMRCEAEGEVMEDTRLVIADAPGSLLMLAGGGEPVRLTRCP